MGPVPGEGLRSGRPAATQALSGNADPRGNNALPCAVRLQPQLISSVGHLLHTRRHRLLFHACPRRRPSVPGEHAWGAGRRQRDIRSGNPVTEFLRKKIVQFQS